MLLATKNKHKLEEMRHALADTGLELRSAFEFVDLPEIEEDADTLEGNALKKARETYALTGLMSVADDTGLEVDALGGRPGVWSARYAGLGASYAQNVDKLLAEMAAYPDPAQRKARFRTVIAVAGPAGEWTVDGECAGEILSERRGDGGFGYDPVFLPEGSGRSFAELTLDEKNGMSHRGRALRAFVGKLSAS
jgi:XTP/dITP diphosphohydrolase